MNCNYYCRRGEKRENCMNYPKRKRTKIHDMLGALEMIKLIVKKMVHIMRNIERWFVTIVKSQDI